jgi:predicted porin
MTWLSIRLDKCAHLESIEMKNCAKYLSIGSACGFLMMQAASAQSNITVYGLIDAGLTWTNTVKTTTGTVSTLKEDTGVSQGSRLGFRGTEDLGNGVSAGFILENGFNLDVGSLGQGGLLFGRKAILSLSSPMGTVILGRQNDFVGDNFPAYAVGANTPSGLIGWSIPTYSASGRTLDNRVWGVCIDNSVKYVSPKINGFSFGALYGLGEQTGQTVAKSSNSFGLNYEQGAFSASVATYYQRDVSTAVGDLQEVAAGAAYNFEEYRFFGMLSKVSASAGTKPTATTADAGVVYNPTPKWALGAGLQFQERNNSVGSAKQITLSADYILSKRTDLYTVVASQKDDGFNAQVVAALGSASPSSSQSTIRVGIRHKF